jgi:hypothetical protein
MKPPDLLDAKLIYIYRFEDTGAVLITHRLEINLKTNAFEYLYRYVNKMQCLQHLNIIKKERGKTTLQDQDKIKLVGTECFEVCHLTQ